MQILFAAPHRLPFLTGSANLVLLALWWLARLLQLHLGWPALPQGALPPALYHAPAMLFLGFAPFIFGFLMTVFPRWMGFPDLAARQFGPAAVLLAAGSLIAQTSLWSGIDAVLPVSLSLVAVGWGLGLASLAGVALTNSRAGKPRCVHAISALAALALGLGALLLVIAALLARRADLLPLANRIAISGFLLPVFLTVAHRMVPFFAGTVLPGYERWRPDWLLALLWALLLAALAGQTGGIGWLAAAANLGLALTTLAMAWKWWPRAPGPGLLMVLFWGLAWAPPGFALAALATRFPELGRAPDHALLIGLCGSLLVAMVTRVTHGHSGRPLAMSMVAWNAFAGLQLATGLRLAAALQLENGALLLAAATMFLLGLAPWCLRHAAIYLRPRLDGKPG